MSAAVVFEREGLDELFAALLRRGYTLIGPTVRQWAVVYDEIGSTADLPRGVTDEQEGALSPPSLAPSSLSTSSAGLACQATTPASDGETLDDLTIGSWCQGSSDPLQ